MPRPLRFGNARRREMMFGLLTKKRFPKPEWFSKIAVPLHTPDKALLENSEYKLLFEYGELQAGLPKADLIPTHPVCPAFTVEKFSLLKKNDGAETFPLALRLPMKGTPFFRARIGGVLAAVRSKDILSLDNYRENGVSFVRKRNSVFLPYIDADGNPMKIKAWMYCGHNEHWRDQVDWDVNYYKGREGSAFSMVNRYINDRPWIGSYFHFTTKDYCKNGTPKCFMHLHRGLRDPNESSSSG